MVETYAIKRVITYGLRYSDYDRQRDLFALRNNGEIEIAGEICYDPDDPEIFGKRMTVAEGLACVHDCIVVCSGTIEEAKKNLGDITDEKIDESSLVYINELAEFHFTEIEKRQIDILKELVDAPDELIRDKEWVGQKLRDYGFFPFFKLAKEPEPGIRWSTVGLLQVPEEFLQFCLYLTDLKCDSAIEVGVARGGSSYIMAAILYRNNPGMKYHMVDIADQLVHFEKAKQIIPSLEKDMPCTSDDFKGKEFDFCFIDADHSYDGMMTDWNNVGIHAKKLTAFHDIFAHEYDGLNGGTVRGWQEIKETVAPDKIREISLFPGRWMGIGMVIH